MVKNRPSLLFSILWSKNTLSNTIGVFIEKSDIITIENGVMSCPISVPFGKIWQFQTDKTKPQWLLNILGFVVTAALQAIEAVRVAHVFVA